MLLFAVYIILSFSFNGFYNIIKEQDFKPRENKVQDRIESFSNLSLFNCQFNHIGDESLNGGAIFLKCDLPNIFYKCNFINCFSLCGGAIFMSTEIKTASFFSYCNFTNNFALICGGSLFMQNSNVILNDCQFKGNNINKTTDSNTGKLGGAVFCDNIETIFQNCFFHKNFIHSIKGPNGISSGGGAIYFSESNFTLINCSYVNNSLFCIDSGDFNDGGAISSNFSARAVIDQCHFTNNSIYSSKSCIINIGGAMFMFSCDITISNCFFIENSLFIEKKDNFNAGGATNFLGSNVSINHCFFMDNEALAGGDILFWSDSSSIQINNCIFNRKKYQNITRTLIALLISSTLNLTFQNNQINLLYSDEIYVFGHELKIAILYCTYSNNCLFPFNKLSIVDPSNNHTVSSGEKEFDFEMMFEDECDEILPTNSKFPPSYDTNPFSRTLSFSKSNLFSKTSLFSDSNHFSQTSLFSNSNCFSQTSLFSNSNCFSQTSLFSDFNHFSQTLLFSNSNCFSQTSLFSDFNHFSQTSLFSKSSLFSQTSLFIDSFERSIAEITNIFSLSSSFTKTDSLMSIVSSNKKPNNYDFSFNTKDTQSIESNNQNYIKMSTQLFTVSFNYTNLIISETHSKKISFIIIFVIILSILIIITIIIFIIFKAKRKKKVAPCSYDESVQYSADYIYNDVENGVTACQL